MILGLGNRRIFFASIVSALLFTGPPSDGRMPRNSEERAIAKLASEHPQQRRPRMTHDAHLHIVARAKARDMARRDYFDHVDPDGFGPNRVITMTGYGLPDHYSKARSGNNVESIVAGTVFTPATAFREWMKSPPHRDHVLARANFYRDQTRFAVGYFRSPDRILRNYYVFLSAPPSTKKVAQLTKRQRDLFLNKTPRQIVRRKGNRP
jgi:uncharacterized protein YkwD